MSGKNVSLWDFFCPDTGFFEITFYGFRFLETIGFPIPNIAWLPRLRQVTSVVIDHLYPCL